MPVDAIAREWGVVVTQILETPSSVIAFGEQDTKPVVLKVVKHEGDEWRCGEVLEAFGGSGVVRCFAHRPGAQLSERLIPGNPLVDHVHHGRDDEATGILASVIARMSGVSDAPRGIPAARDWASGFARYVASGDRQLPRSLVDDAHHLYLALCASQQAVRLLHGDLHHDNVLYDDERGWVAIDPKGVVGEVEFEVGAALRNPRAYPELQSDASRVTRRVQCFASALELDERRVLAWAFSQAVLSAIWSIEDDGTLEAYSPAMLLAATTRSMLPIVGDPGLRPPVDAP